MASEQKSEESEMPEDYQEIYGGEDPVEPSDLESLASSALRQIRDMPYVLGSDTSSEASRSVRSQIFSDVLNVAQFYEARGNSAKEAYGKAKADFRKRMTKQDWFKKLSPSKQNELRKMIDLKPVKMPSVEQAVATPAMATVQQGEYKQPDGKPVKYKEEYKKVFQGYSVQAFRQHIAQTHPELKRQSLPPKGQREKATQVLAQVNGIIRGFGFLIGLKRVKARTKKGEPDYYEKIFEEREELREMVYAKILLPHLKMKPQAPAGIPEPSLLEQDIQATAQQPPSEPSIMPPASQEVSPSQPFRIGAIIDIEKLNISTEALRDVLMGRIRDTPAQADAGKEPERQQPKPQEGEQGGLMPDLPPAQQDATGAARRLAPEDPLPIPPAVQQAIDENADAEFKQRIKEMPKTPEAIDAEIEGLKARIQAQLEASGGRNTPAVMRMERNLNALREVQEWIATLPMTGQPDVKPAPPAPTPAKPANPHDATKDKLKKPTRQPFVPSRRRVLEKARNLVLRRPSRAGLATLDEVRRYPENTNSFAPDPVETVRGRFKAIM